MFIKWEELTKFSWGEKLKIKEKRGKDDNDVYRLKDGCANNTVGKKGLCRKSLCKIFTIN